jgi:hypothetical protein
MEGKKYLIAKALESKTHEKRSFFANLAAEYKLNEEEILVVKLLQSKEFNFENLYNLIGKNVSNYMKLSNQYATQKLEGNKKEDGDETLIEILEKMVSEGHKIKHPLTKKIMEGL